MKISIKNLGAIKQAEFELGDLTIICGENNTGKTYATHATYAFFDFLKSNARFTLDKSTIQKLLNEGVVTIDLNIYIKNFNKSIQSDSTRFSKILSNVFAGDEKHFEQTKFSVHLDQSSLVINSQLHAKFGSAEKSVLDIKSVEGKNQLVATLIIDKLSDEVPPHHVLESMLIDSIRDALFIDNIPNPFLASAERTGAAIFQKELDFTRNRLIEFLGDKSSKISPIQLLGKFSGEYPIAVRRNVDFIRNLPNLTHREGFLLKKYPEILKSFSDIIGGEYKVSKDGEVQFLPNGNKRIKLSLVESSSAVRSLLDIGFYLRHVASPGDLLMVDEPELNLHPANQRRVARLFSQLVNLGIKVFITTHSDYIIKELNTLIMLNQKDERLQEIARNEGYKKSELLDANKVKVYMAVEELVKVDGAQRKTKCQTLVAADIDSKLGIEAKSFDKTIEDMNRIQDEIVWGA